MHEGFDIAGRVAVITGGTSGLGRAVAVGMAKAGARVFVGSRDAGKVADALAELQAIDAANDGFALDVTDPQALRAAYEAVRDKAGRIDILVNAAGITQRATALDATLEDWERVLRINLTGTFLSSQAAARIMREQESGGSVLNFGSLSSFRGWALTAAYGASKAAVIELTQTLAVEWAQYGIRVNALAPGVFPTSINAALINGTSRGRWFQVHTPAGRFGKAEEIVGAAIFLSSPAAQFVTGETLAVDGGFLALGVAAEPPV